MEKECGAFAEDPWQRIIQPPRCPYVQETGHQQWHRGGHRVILGFNLYAEYGNSAALHMRGYTL